MKCSVPSRFFAAVLKRLRHVEGLKKSLAEAAIEWSVGRVILMMLVIGTITLNVLLRLDLIPYFGAWICATAAAATPLFYIRRKRRLRLRAVEEALPEALDFLSRALVAGHSLPMSLELLAEEADRRSRTSCVKRSMNITWACRSTSPSTI